MPHCIYFCKVSFPLPILCRITFNPQLGQTLPHSYYHLALVFIKETLGPTCGDSLVPHL